MKNIRRTLSASTLLKTEVYNLEREYLGTIKEIMIDVVNGKVSYIVLSFPTFMHLSHKLFAIPYELLKIDEEQEIFHLDISKDVLENAPGFDKNKEWPDFDDEVWAKSVTEYYRA
ncbi:MAG: hypothetical protein Tsb005_16740 [Gammaproteobacteria bacterium]